MTPEESRQFGALFAQYDAQGAGRVPGDIAYQLFIKSGLSTDVLRKVWNVADADNNGSLDLPGFAKAMRMIYHLQKGKPFGPALATIPAMVPSFAPTAPQAQTTGQSAARSAAQTPAAYTATGQSTTQSTTQTPAIPALGTADKARFGSLFDKHAKNGLLDGPSSRDIFSKANLDQATLTQIWNLVDVRQIGSLRRNEFVLAMHLIQSSLNGSLSSIPASLPSQWHPWLEGKATYTVSPQDKQKYDSHFQGLQNDGVVGAEAAAGFLTKSGLSEDVLATIWDLADYHERGFLDQTGFSIAMFLVNRKLQGGELPSSTPAELIETASGKASAVTSPVTSLPASPAARTFSPTQRFHQPQAPQVQAQAQPAAQPPAPVPQSPQTTQPVQPTSTRQVSGSMTDLMNLDDTFFGDVKSPVLSPNASGVPTKEAFVPKSTFGQSLVSGPSHKEVSAKVQESRNTHAELSQKLASTQALNTSTRDEVKSLEAEKAQLDKEIASLRITYDQAAAGVYQLQQQIKATKEEMQRLEKDHNLRKSGLNALETQHRDLAAQLETLRSQTDAHASATAELEEQRAAHARNLEALHAEQQSHETQHREHTERHAALQGEIEQLSSYLSSAQATRGEAEERSQSAIAQSESLAQQLEALRAEVTSAEQAAERAEAEARDHEARVQEQQRELEALKEQRQRQYEAQQQHQRSIEASKQRQVELERGLHTEPEHPAHSSLGAAIGAAIGTGAAAATHVATHAETHTNPDKPPQPATIVGGPIGGVSANEYSSIETSPQTSYKGTTISNRSSPRTSEFQMPQAAVPPSFTLPMARPQSASSSVQNNPPQSVRGDTEDVSVPVSPEFQTTEPVSGIVPPESLEIADTEDSRLYAHSGKSSDSFEFVDANDDEALHHQQKQRSNSRSASTSRPADESSDDEGPEELPVMPHAVYSRDAHAPTTNAKYSGVSPVSASRVAPAGSGSAQAPVPPMPAHDDFGDAFDDLEEAEVSDEDLGAPTGAQGPATPPFSSPFATQDAAASAPAASAPQQSGPSEWQQLFADQADKPLPATPAEPVSPAVAELMQMGFPKERAIEALRQCDNNPSEAINLLLDE